MEDAMERYSGYAPETTPAPEIEERQTEAGMERYMEAEMADPHQRRPRALPETQEQKQAKIARILEAQKHSQQPGISSTTAPETEEQYQARIEPELAAQKADERPVYTTTTHPPVRLVPARDRASEKWRNPAASNLAANNGAATRSLEEQTRAVMNEIVGKIRKDPQANSQELELLEHILSKWDVVNATRNDETTRRMAAIAFLKKLRTHYAYKAKQTKQHPTPPKQVKLVVDKASADEARRAIDDLHRGTGGEKSESAERTDLGGMLDVVDTKNASQLSDVEVTEAKRGVGLLMIKPSE